MGIRLGDLRRGGAVGAICLRYYQMRGKKDRWAKLAEWCGREWPDASTQTITAVIEHAKKAVELAHRINRQKDTTEITGDKEKELRGR